MGVCTSCQSTNIATAKLILQDGTLQEFPYPVKVSFLLDNNPSCFICNSDDMDFDDVVSAVHHEDHLQPGHLYFALPLTWLKHPLPPQQMAALAVKASSALMKNGLTHNSECSRKCVSTVEFSGQKTRRKSSKGRRNKFNAMLSTIPE